MSEHVMKYRMNQELNDFDSITEVSVDEFKSGFAAGLATVGVAFLGIKAFVFGK